MKVGLFFSDPAPQSGGVFTFQQDMFHSFLELASESRHEFNVICEFKKAPAFASIALPGNVRISPMDRRQRPWKARLYYERYRAAFGYPKRPSEEATALAKYEVEFSWSMGHYEHEAFDVPYLTTVFDLQHRLQPWFPEVSSGGLWTVREDFFQKYVGRAAYVLTGTEEGRGEIRRFYNVPEERIRILPLPTPSYCLQPSDDDWRARIGKLGVSGPYLFYPAQFWAHKNHANLLRALKILNAGRQQPYRLALVGSDHGNLAYVRELAQTLGIADLVHFLGFVSQPDLVALYRGASLLAFSSFFGPDNLPPLEAFALGCPVVMAEYDGAREQLGDAALYVRGTDPQAMADGYLKVLSSQELREGMIARGRERGKAWTTRDYIRSVFRLFDEFEAVRRCWA